jgi:hypothetical protein
LVVVDDLRGRLLGGVLTLAGQDDGKDEEGDGQDSRKRREPVADLSRISS